ncbi:hypothetical protein G7046_g2316 [Stylonectria norvegica]|nr:hypothetical protein G7046_g2316 [Stylonectria norvegica]
MEPPAPNDLELTDMLSRPQSTAVTLRSSLIFQDSTQSLDTPLIRHPLSDEEPEETGNDQQQSIRTPSPTALRTCNRRTNRLSLWLRLTTIGSFAVLLIVVAFLTWMWFANHEQELWRRLMLSGRSTQAITLTGVLVRTATGALAVIATSMAASIALERRGVPLDTAAEVSIARFTNGGPQSIFMLLVSSSAFDGFLRVLVIGLLVFGFAAQFTSTLLVTDMEPTNVISLSEKKNSFFSFSREPNDVLDGQNYNYWMDRPSSSEIFAEYSESIEPVVGVDDTGPTIRALLPWALQSDREQLRTFKGMAQVIDARVTCIRPQMNLSFCSGVEAAGHVFRQDWLLCITLTADVGDLQLGSVPMARIKIDSWALCESEGGCGLISTLTNTTFLNNSADCKVAGNSWLVTKMSVGQLDKNTTELEPWTKLNTTVESGSWLRQSWRHTALYEHLYYDIRASWCFDALAGLQPQHTGNTLNVSSTAPILNITASSLEVIREPGFSLNTRKKYDTLGVRDQLGATNKSQNHESNREIMAISAEDMDMSLATIRGKPYPSEWESDNGWQYSWLYTRLFLNFDALVLCRLCNPSSYNGIQGHQLVSDVLSSLFLDTLDDTDSPALAIQALQTTVLRMTYYDYISAFSASYNATITRFVLANVPKTVRPWGYTAVVLILAANMLLFVIIYILFHRTHSSLIGNAWQTVAQVSQSAEAREILEHARDSRDKELKKWMYGESQANKVDRHVLVDGVLSLATDNVAVPQPLIHTNSPFGLTETKPTMCLYLLAQCPVCKVTSKYGWDTCQRYDKLLLAACTKQNTPPRQEDCPNSTTQVLAKTLDMFHCPNVRCASKVKLGKVIYRRVRSEEEANRIVAAELLKLHKDQALWQTAYEKEQFNSFAKQPVLPLSSRTSELSSRVKKDEK